jgi:beta-galactosidase
MPYAISAMPEGYQLQVYDDCGAPDRQPHIVQTTAHTFSAAEVNADERVRSVAWGWKQVDAVYDNLDPNLDYILAVTYANEAFNNRVQSLWADGVQLHGPHPLPKGGAERLLFRIPREAIKNGRLALQFKLEAQVNVVVSIVELWAAAPSPKALRLCDLSGLFADLEGKVLDLRCDPIPDAAVELRRKGSSAPLVTAKTGPDGIFRFARSLLDNLEPKGDMEIVARSGEMTASRTIAKEDLYFEPVRYRPIPTKVRELRANQISLDGIWRIRTDDGRRTRGNEEMGKWGNGEMNTQSPNHPITQSPNHPITQSPNHPDWGDFRVPGQWLQQGYDVLPDKTVTVAREFTVPKTWAKYRVFLRFDAIHAGTRYRLNGKDLGYSENLFTPVEWEVTEAVRPGQTNRLELEMTVDTPSERLSYASGYAFHSLGGIDRSVRLYALPPVHVRDMRIATDLDKEYRDADLRLHLTLDNPGPQAETGLSLHVSLYGPDGKPVAHSSPEVAVGAVPAGRAPVETVCHVPDPVKWNAEKPRLHRLVLELRQNGEVIERIERSIGFRKIEIKGEQLYVNGRRVKLAGACHHETDPLTGRADTMRHAWQDVKLLKAASLNYIRTSHYPPCQELLDAADRLGMYVEVEAPFCWVGEVEDMSHLKEVLTPTSAMVDYCHAHPSVLVWSLANESSFNRLFEVSSRLVKALDPTRPTTFNNPDPKRLCDIANLHYAPMPFDAQLKDDPRPLFWGEYWFPVCHEQTDVRIDPGLRELWGHGHADPDSAWGRFCASNYDPATMRPGEPPGAWSYIIRSDRVVGGAIWAALDEPFYFANGKRAGYAWVHGFWGLIDAWRRPKPEWWLSKLIFSPVWFPVRRADFSPGQTTVRIPVENRYSFTNLNELQFIWQVGRKAGRIRVSVPPGTTGEIALPIPPGTREGETLILRVKDAGGELVSALALQLGNRPPKPLPKPQAGAPRWRDDGKTITVEGETFRMALDRATLRISAAGSPVIEFPAPHVTQYDFGDLDGPYRRPYAVLPDTKTRVVESVAAAEKPEGLEITVKDRYEGFAGSVRWLIDRRGMGRVAYDYTCTGPNMSAREVGLRFLLKPECDEVSWKRWSEWGVYPEDSISRTEGKAKARRDPKWGDVPKRPLTPNNGGTDLGASQQTPPELGAGGQIRPAWPWFLDQTELGTNDFRSVKFNIYEAKLSAPDGEGLRVYANADAHVRPCLDPAGVRMHILSRCGMGPAILKTGDRIAGEYAVELTGSPR